MNQPATRQTQPHRKGINRAPSPVLDRMLAGKKQGDGAVLLKAMANAKSAPKRPMPRW